MRFENRTALVTGGANGIGREIVRRFAAEGARVVSLDVDERGNQETASLVRQAGGCCEILTGDVASAADVARAAAQAGAVDILVNNAAAWSGDGVLHRVREEDWDRVMAVSLKSVYLCVREVVPGMIVRRSGRIVHISSVNALTGIHLAAYSAAKGGMLSLTRVMAAQYGRYGIRTNAICPGTIMTESSRRFYDTHREQEEQLRALYPGGEFGVPEDVAGCAAYLASAEANFMNGAVIVLDGGLSAVHRLPAAAGDEA